MALMNIDYAIRRYGEAQAERSPYEPDWRAVSSHMGGRSRAAWNSIGMPVGSSIAPGNSNSFDSTGSLSLPKYVSILQRMMTPDGLKWVRYRASDPALMRIRPVRDYFDQLTDVMQRLRYKHNARFVQTRGQMYAMNGMYGCMPSRIGWKQPDAINKSGGFGYKALHLRDVFFTVDDDGAVDTVFYRFYIRARQFETMFPGVKPPKAIADELSKTGGPSERHYEFVHMCYLAAQNDYNEHALDVRRHPARGAYFCIASKEYIGEERGYRSMPLMAARTGVEAGGHYGTSPAMRALPAMGGASQTKKTMIKQGHKSLDPPLLANDDGILGGRVDQRPGSVTYGAVDNQGRVLVRALETGNFNPSKEILQDDRTDIEDSFFVTVFKILEEQPDITATVAVELIAQKTALLAPTMGEIQAEDLGPWLQREIDLVAEYAPGLLPEMPPELIEARGDYETIFTSPMAKSLYAEEDAGFMRIVETAMSIAQATGDPSPMDHFNFDVAIPELADHRSVPARWMATEDELKAARDERNQQMSAEQLTKVAAPAASVATALMKPNKAA